MNGVSLVVLYVALNVALVWAAGYLLALEDVIGGTRHRWENAAYRNAELFRADDRSRDWEVDLFWDRAQPWGLTRARSRPIVDVSRATVTQATPSTITVAGPPTGSGPTRMTVGVPLGASRWTYRGQGGFSPDDAGRKVPTRLLRSGTLAYAVPTLDGVPLGRADRLATILRTKTADLWGCPKCSGMWGGAIAAAVMFGVGLWPFGWALAAVLHVAAWGLARRIGWSE